MSSLQREAESGRLDGTIVARLARVTESWDPLAITHGYHDDSSRELELFRRKTYFKEPLSDFYNYRYLFYLEETGLLESHTQGYTIMRVTFTNLEQINKERGYLVTDQIIDEVGSSLYEAIENLSKTEAQGCVIILLRKGTSYLIYSNCPDPVIDAMDREIQRCSQRLSQEWQGKTQRFTLRFAGGHPVQDAVYQVLDRVVA